MDLSARSLHVKRQVLDKFLNGGLYPYTKRYIQTFDHHFSTIGLIGMNEAGINAKWLQASLLKKGNTGFLRRSSFTYEETFVGVSTRIS